VKLLQVNATQHFGGAETVARQLRAGCARAGHESVLLVAYGKRFDRRAGVEPMYPRPLSRLHMSRLHGITEALFPHQAWTDRAMSRLAGSRWDVVHVHNFHGDYARIETLAALSRRKPVVWTFHGSWGFTGGCDHTGGCERYQSGCGDCPQIGRWSFLAVDDTQEQLRRKVAAFRGARFRVVSPSRWLASRIAASQVGAGWDVRVIPNGVDTQIFGSERKRQADFRRGLGIDADATVVLLVNRNFKDDTKGFARARAALLAAADEHVQVVLAGQHAQWAADTLPGVRARALGFVEPPALAPYYESADVLLFPSPEETFPCAVLEAMAAGCCVVSTPTAGAREQIDDGVSGILAAGFSDVDLAASLREALRRPDLRERCGGAARQRVLREFSEQQMVASYLALYREAEAGAACN
jgi:glycosyltransferase involved in cell wall biosynthesis